MAGCHLLDDVARLTSSTTSIGTMQP